MLRRGIFYSVAFTCHVYGVCSTTETYHVLKEIEKTEFLNNIPEIFLAIKDFQQVIE